MRTCSLSLFQKHLNGLLQMHAVRQRQQTNPSIKSFVTLSCARCALRMVFNLYTMNCKYKIDYRILCVFIYTAKDMFISDDHITEL